MKFRKCSAQKALSNFASRIPVTACKRTMLDFGSGKLLFHVELFIFGRANSVRVAASSLTGETLAAIINNFGTMEKNLTNDTLPLESPKQQIFIETAKKEACTDCNFNICDCELLINLIWPLTLLTIIALFYQSLSKLFSRIASRGSKFKWGEFEIELHDLENVTSRVERKTKVTSQQSRQNERRYIYDFNVNDTKHLPLEILKVSSIIENQLKNLYVEIEPQGSMPLSVPELIESLRYREVYDQEITNMLRKFWVMRNNIVHAIKFDVVEEEFASVLDIGYRIVKILDAIRS